MRTELIVRFDYGSIVPWVSQQEDGRLQFIAGPDRLLLDGPGSDARRGSSHRRRFHRRRGRRGKLRTQLVAVVSRRSSAALRGGTGGGAQTSQFLLDWMGDRFQAAGTLGRRRSSLTFDVEGARALGELAALSPPARRRCPKSWAARAIGIIDTAGFGTRRSPFMR